MKTIIFLLLGMICIVIAALATPVSIVWALLDWCSADDYPFKTAAYDGLMLWLKMIAFIIPGIIFYFLGIMFEVKRPNNVERMKELRKELKL